MARYIVDVLEDKKAQDIVLLDLRPDAIIADFFIVCTGTSDRQLKALTTHIRQGMRDSHAKLPYSVEGQAESGWVLMDYGDVVVHLFLEAQREYYDLEGLWQEAQVLVNIQ